MQIMGSASAKPIVSRNQSAQVLTVHERLFLIDCGEAVQRQLMIYRVPTMKIDSIFISHIHGDHVFGLFPLLSTMGMIARNKPLTIYAPASFGPLLKFFMSYYGDGVGYEVRHVPLKMSEPQLIYETRKVEVLAFPLNHKIETFGFLVREKTPMHNVRPECISRYDLNLTEIGTLKRGEDVIRDDNTIITAQEAAYIPYQTRSYAYCSDTAPFPELSQWVKGVDLLYHESTYTQEYLDLAIKRHHSTTVQAAQCALEAGVGKLVIGHYSSRNTKPEEYLKEAKTVFPETYAAKDGDIYDVPFVKMGR